MTAGKWQNGDQITQVKQDDEGVVMRRRTVTTGGSLSGAAHPDAPKSNRNSGYGKAAANQASYPKSGSSYGQAGYENNSYDD
jgi:hypothetical protein